MVLDQTNRGFMPSSFQSNIFAWIKDPIPESRFAIISAVAGSGKSTTLIEGLKFISPTKKVLFVAFMAKNVADLKPKLPGYAEAKTLNSVGNGAWIRFVGSRPEIEKSLNYELMDEFIDPDWKKGGLDAEIKRELVNNYRSSFGVGVKFDNFVKYLEGNFSDEREGINKLVSLAKGHGIVPSLLIEKYGPNYVSLMDDSFENWKGLINTYDVDVEMPMVSVAVARRILVRSVEVADKKIDFDSQLWLPIIHNANFFQFDWVLADECQDQNSIQNAIIAKIVKPGGRGIFVGDENQSIFQFRGALCNGMNVIRTMFNAQPFPLSICYRCAKNIVKHAKEIVDHIEWSDHQIDGEVKYAQEFGPAVFNEKDIILCRNNAPIIDLTYKLLRAKVPCRILGRDVESGLVRLVKLCAGKRGNTSVDHVIEKLAEHETREIAKVADKRDQSLIDRIKDKCDTIRVFINELPEHDRTVKRLTANIENMFKPKVDMGRKCLNLSSIHRSKGLEYDHVYILTKKKSKSRNLSDEAAQQEQNILYVARTRAKKSLVYLDLDMYDDSYKLSVPQFEGVAV